MKKFITVIPMQPPEKFKKLHYAAPENDKLLSNNMETRFPIFVAVSNCVKQGENISVTAVITDNHDNVTENMKYFLEELEELRARIGFEYELTELHTSKEETPEKHLALFGDMIGIFKDGDEIYADMTYGTKPTPMVIMMSLSYAYEICSNTDVKAVIYGSKDHSADTGELFDISSMFYINSVIHRMSAAKPSDPLAFIKDIIDI